MALDVVIDFDAEPDKRKLWGVLKHLKGRYRVEIAKFRPRRSDKQNRYYWGVVVPAAIPFLTETQGEAYDVDRAHSFFKGMILAREIHHRGTGELLSIEVGSSKALTTSEFSEYVEKVVRFLAENGGIFVPPPESYLSDNR